jgi:MFS family permease
MARLVLDPRGRLVELEVVPPALVALRAGAAPDWAPLFAAAGLDAKGLVPATPRWTVPVASDERAAWEGTIPDHPDLAMRVEAAAYAGRPVHFVVATPGGRPTLQKPEGFDREQWAAAAIASTLLGTVLVGGLVLARRNLRLGRGDRGGAFKIAAAAFAIGIATHLLGADPTMTFGGLAALLWHAVTQALGFSVLAWLLYVALEPYVRRNRPELIVSWTRLLAGEWRSPMVGRDALLGALLGLAASASFVLGGWLKVAFAAPQPPNRIVDTLVLGGTLPALAELVGRAGGAIAFSFATLVFVALARRPLRTEARAALVLWLAMWAMQVLFTARSWPMVVAAGLTSALAILVVTRLGLVAGFVFQLVHTATIQFPLTTDFSAFYAGTTAMVLALVAGSAIGAYRISLGARRAAVAEVEVNDR